MNEMTFTLKRFPTTSMTRFVVHQLLTKNRRAIESTFQRIDYHIRLKQKTCQQLQSIDRVQKQTKSELQQLMKLRKTLDDWYSQCCRNQSFSNSHRYLFSNHSAGAELGANHFLPNTGCLTESSMNSLYLRSSELDDRIELLNVKIGVYQQKKERAKLRLENEVHNWVQETKISCRHDSQKSQMYPYSNRHQDHLEFIATSCWNQKLGQDAYSFESECLIMNINQCTCYLSGVIEEYTRSFFSKSIN